MTLSIPTNICLVSCNFGHTLNKIKRRHVFLSGCTKLVDYCSSKFGAVGIHEALKTELRSQGHDKYIKTSVVCPYFINTGMFDGVSASVSRHIVILSMLVPTC